MLSFILTLAVRQLPFFLDLEWPYDHKNRQAGKPQEKVTVLQLLPHNCDTVYIFRLDPCSNKLPAAIQLLLRHVDVLFVGLGIKNDIKKLTRDYPDECTGEGFRININDIREYFPNCRQDIGLQKLAAKVLKIQLEKSFDHSHWGRNTLSRAQKDYASLDVYVLQLLWDAQDALISPFSLTSTSSGDTDESDGAAMITRVKLDAFHWFQRIRTPKDHIYNMEFANALRDAVFIVDPVDKSHVDRICQEQFHTTFQKEYDKGSKWVLQRVKRIIPGPDILEKRVRQVLDHYKDEKVS